MLGRRVAHDADRRPRLDEPVVRRARVERIQRPVRVDRRDVDLSRLRDQDWIFWLAPHFAVTSPTSHPTPCHAGELHAEPSHVA